MSKENKAIDTVVNKISALRRTLDLSDPYIKDMDKDLLDLQKKFNRRKK